MPSKASRLVAVIISITATIAISFDSARAGGTDIEDFIASTIKEYSRVPESTSVIVQQCRIEITIAHSDMNHCSHPENIDLRKITLSLDEIDQVRFRSGVSGRAMLDFEFRADVSNDLERALEIWAQLQPPESPSAQKKSEQIASSRAFRFLESASVAYQDALTDCEGVRHFQIRSTRSHLIPLAGGVPIELFQSIQEYQSMCELAN